MLRLIHTADWHLGQSFHGQERTTEHRAFLRWLLDTLEQQQADVLLVAGDIFDVVNPSLRAQQLLYDFIVETHQRCPDLHMVLIAGNHDSGARIELPAPLMQRLHAHALGRVSWLDDGSLDSQRLLVPLSDANGDTQAWCMALPFLRPAEITGRGGQQSAIPSEDDRPDNSFNYVSSVEHVHQQLINAAREQRQPGQALIAMSHAHLHGAAVSEASERPIVIGGEESISASVFPADISYVALGHLHRAQRVGEERIRYSGSPLPLDFSEVGYPNQVLILELDGERLGEVQSLPVPRAVTMQRIGPCDLNEALEQIAQLPSREQSRDTEYWAWLEITIRLDAPMADLRSRIDEGLADRAARLLRLRRELPGGDQQQQPRSGERLEDIGPRQLFERVWQEQWGAPAEQDVLSDFDRLCQDVLDADEDGLEQDRKGADA
ncbi:exonuclease SbcCD subunit D C-terminal domain-containing protein [Halomonas huangheensis]|uniref:Nuclease SbcCD subunit D n=1 Tax=Halomonas huangheensis TaxID=1178482 RepID=W1N8A1_9GAMM|nr:exonuclease SbcCD subunit D C-terminal domain-containing protein [Halomonas huangheensis]ALM53227.1 exonuclease SbcD [Halomonas huangheensis]ERL51406.1 hypothetical protein BJB45_13385 [Halomonas huangheensis]